MFPTAVQILERNLDSLLTFFQFDSTYWTSLGTTNPTERLNKEFKRRTKAMEVTGGEISTYRCLAYVAQTMEYRWSFHPLSQWSAIFDRKSWSRESQPSCLLQAAFLPALGDSSAFQGWTPQAS